MQGCTTTIQSERFQLTELKQEVTIGAHVSWATVRGVLERVVGLWAADYNRLTQAGYDVCFSFPTQSAREAHCRELAELMDFGCDLVLIIHHVEDHSNPPIELKQMEADLTNALRALKIAKSAYSQSTNGLHVSALAAELG